MEVVKVTCIEELRQLLDDVVEEERDYWFHVLYDEMAFNLCDECAQMFMESDELEIPF